MCFRKTESSNLESFLQGNRPIWAKSKQDQRVITVLHIEPVQKGWKKWDYLTWDKKAAQRFQENIKVQDNLQLVLSSVAQSIEQEEWS